MVEYFGRYFTDSITNIGQKLAEACVVFFALYLFSCQPTANTENLSKETVKIDTTFLLWKTYYNMSEVEYLNLTRQDSSLINDGRFELLTNGEILNFKVYPEFGNSLLKSINLELESDFECHFSDNKMLKKTVEIFTGRKLDGDVLKLNETKLLTKNIEKYNVKYARSLMGDRYGIVPRFTMRIRNSFTEPEAFIDDPFLDDMGNAFWIVGTKDYVSNGLNRLNSLIKIFSEKYGQVAIHQDNKSIEISFEHKLQQHSYRANYVYGDVKKITYFTPCFVTNNIYSWKTDRVKIELEYLAYSGCASATECNENELVKNTVIKYFPIVDKNEELRENHRIERDSTNAKKSIDAI